MSITGAVEQQQQRPPSPWEIVAQYGSQLAEVLPSHLRGEVWLRNAQAALKRGKPSAGNPGRTELEQAAINNLGVFVNVLRDAARVGLVPGTDEFYLSIRRNSRGVPEIEGTIGYQGYIELMHRAGKVATVTTEIVYAADKFSYRPGDDRPQHDIDWDLDLEERGERRLVYAYARDAASAMVGKVVVLTRADIERIKKSSSSAQSERHADKSPWNTHTDAMWIKSAVRQLRKWVPTSTELITSQIRAARAGQQAADVIPGDTAALLDDVDGEVIDMDPAGGDTDG